MEQLRELIPQISTMESEVEGNLYMKINEFPEQKKMDVSERKKEYALKFGCPVKYLDCTLKSYIPQTKNQQRILESCVQIVKSGVPKYLVSFLGPCGTGKTHIATAMVIAFMCRERRRFYWVKSGEMIDSIRKATLCEGGDYYEMEKYHSFKRSGILVIDDLGSERHTEFSEEKIYSIIDKRYTSELPLFITSNLSLNEISQRYGDRIASRMCAGEVFIFEGNDYRMRGKV